MVTNRAASDSHSAQTSQDGHVLRRAKDSNPGDAPARNEAERFTELYERHFDFVWRSVRLLGVPAESADDAVQDVFLVAHRRQADYESRTSPRTWLFSVAFRVVSDHRRSQRRRMRLLERARSVPPGTSATPLEEAVTAETCERLLSALDALPEQQRVVFTLTELEEMSAPEIAAALQMNLHTVYARLRAARKLVTRKLRDLIGPGVP
jgi:RNA polymerase sigma-70 factor (ECF subfamily)